MIPAHTPDEQSTRLTNLLAAAMGIDPKTIRRLRLNMAVELLVTCDVEVVLDANRLKKALDETGYRDLLDLMKGA